VIRESIDDLDFLGCVIVGMRASSASLHFPPAHRSLWAGYASQQVQQCCPHFGALLYVPERHTFLKNAAVRLNRCPDGLEYAVHRATHHEQYVLY
jgi:hypothetical protein